MSDEQSNQGELGELGLLQLPGKLLEDGDADAELWYEAQPKWPDKGGNGIRATKGKWLEVAGEALSAASRMFDKMAGSSNISKTKNLTTSDKIATYTLAVQENPVFRLDELQMLVSSAKQRGEERRLAIDALKDLFISNLLPDSRRLVAFHDRDFLCERSTLTKRHLVYALFESELKTIYQDFIQVLEQCGRDNIHFVKKKSLETIFELLVAKPESEQLLMSMLVNKLGDPEKSISSSASYLLSKLISKHHPQMRFVVVREVTQMLRRPNINRRAQYFAICFLNQINFRNEDTELARSIIQIYMDLFVICHNENTLKKPEPVATINPETGEKTKKKHTRAKKKKQKKREEELAKREIAEETQNSKFMAALLIGVNRAYPFTKPEQDSTTYDKHFDNFFRIAHAASFGPATQALAFLLQISQSNSTQSDRLYKAIYDRLLDAPEVSERIQASFLNLVLKAIRMDTDSRRVKAFIKRLLQSAVSAASAYAGACMVILFELFRKGQGSMLKSFLSLPENDDEDEIFFDLDKLDESKEEDTNPSDAESNDPDSESEVAQKNKKKTIFAKKPGDTMNEASLKADDQFYDPKKRDPKFARAERSSLWEAVTLAAHYHPSVSMFATSMCSDLKRSEINGDPLRDYSLITFLDRFCYTRSKNRIKKSLYGKTSSRFRDLPLANSSEFQRLVESGKIEEDDKFLAKYFEQNPQRVAKDEIDEFDSGSDVDSEDEAYDQAIEAEMKRLGADMSSFGRGPDIDEEDADELKAFDEAFGKEIVDSDGENDVPVSDKSDGEEANEVFMLPSESNHKNKKVDVFGTNSDSDDDIDDRRTTPSQKMKKMKKFDEEGTFGKPNMSVFALAEDYEDAIEKHLKNASSDEPEEPVQAEAGKTVKKSRRRDKKRRTSGQGDRPNKRRR